MVKKKNIDSGDGWTSMEMIPTKKTNYEIRINAPNKKPNPYEQIEVTWNGKTWIEDGQFEVPVESVLSWKEIS